MTSISSNVDTCLVCSLTVPNVVSDNRDICRKVFSLDVSAVKWQLKLQQVAHIDVNNCHIPCPTFVTDKKRTHDWHSWNNPFLYLRTPFMDRNQSNVTKIFPEWWSSWCVDAQDLQDILLIRVQFSAVCLHWYFIMY